MAPALVVTIVRHGETDENRLRIVQGQLDTKLSAAGRQQAAMVAAALAVPEVPFSHAFSSDLSRSVEVCSSSEWSGSRPSSLGQKDRRCYLALPSPSEGREAGTP